MKILKSIAVAFSMYSRIPMPHFKWDSEDMKYHLIFFPWIGAVIGILEYVLYLLYKTYSFPQLAFVAFVMALPLIITGGFHLDGFMDVSDALSSWQPKEKRLEILKDPHIGAFAIINMVIMGLILFGSVLAMSPKAYVTWCFSFFVARCISGMCVIKGKKAKEEGLLHTEAKTASDNLVFYSLLVELIICFIAVGIYNIGYALIMFVTALATCAGIIKQAYSNFGGITGDVMGYYVVYAELLTAVFLNVISLFK